jgi:hypothetical protein
MLEMLMVGAIQFIDETMLFGNYMIVICVCVVVIASSNFLIGYILYAFCN